MPIYAYIGWYGYVILSLGPLDTMGVVFWPLEWRGIGWADVDVIWVVEQGPGGVHWLCDSRVDTRV